MNFLVDAQLPKRLAIWLSNNGHPSIHTLDLPQGNKTPDNILSQIADTDRRILITKDADFVESHLLQQTPQNLLLLSTGNMSNNELIQVFENNMPKIIEAFATSAFLELNQFNLIIRG